MAQNLSNDTEPEGPHVLTHFGKRLAELADIKKGSSVLDLGMGSGTSLFPATEKVGKTGKVIGIDISKDMVKRTYDKIIDNNLTNAQVMQTDAKSLIFKDNTFDVVLSGFSYIYSTLEEIKRVLKKGGQFGLSTWKTLEDMGWMASCLRKYMPIDSKKVYHQDTPHGLRILLSEAGFTNSTVITEEKEFAYPNEEQWWADMRESGWDDHLKKIEDMGPGKLEVFKKEALRKVQIYKKEQCIPFTVAVRFAFGTK